MSAPYYSYTTTAGGELSVNPKANSTRPTTVVLGSILVHALAATSIGLIIYLIRDNFDATLPPNKLFFHSFGMHPILMAFGFAFLSPLGAMAYKTYEHLLGVSHRCAKLTHAFLQTLALVSGVLGFAVMWTVHTGGLHFQTAHSWIGAFGLGLFTLQWGMGVVVYLLPRPASAKLRATMMPVHVFVGGTATALTLISCITGVLALVWKPVPLGAQPKDTWRLANIAACVMAALLVAIMFVYYEAGRLGLGKANPFNTMQQGRID